MAALFLEDFYSGLISFETNAITFNQQLPVEFWNQIWMIKKPRNVIRTFVIGTNTKYVILQMGQD